MNRKLLVKVGSGALVLLFLIYTCDFAIEWHRRHVAERLIREVQQLQIAITTQDEVNRLLSKFGKRLSPDTLTTSSDPGTLSASVDFSSPNLIIGEGRTLPGRRLWLMSVLLVVKDRRLSEAYVRFLIRRSDGVHLYSVIDLSQGDPILEGRSYFVSRPHITGPPAEALKVHLGPGANAAERARAFDINFSCLTALNECKHICDVNPDAWHDLLSRYPVGERDQVDAECGPR